MAREHLREADLDKHQKDAVWRVLQTGSTLLAHVVGAGKTLRWSQPRWNCGVWDLQKSP